MCGKGLWGSCNGFSLKDKPRRVEGQRVWHKRHRGRRGPQRRTHFRAESLRPATRAAGMRAPRNTNQFLMQEKYQLLHMRSDSVGTDSGSDCELDYADMDAYLGVLENARGALLDSPEPPSPPTARQLGSAFGFFGFGEQEESLQYFPSEDDVLQSEDFMRKDFNAFCDAVAPCT